MTLRIPFLFDSMEKFDPSQVNLMFSTLYNHINSPYVEYGATSNVLGWSAFSARKVYYKQLGRLVFVNYYIGGASNDTACSFTVPLPSVDPYGTWAALPFVYDNTAYLTTLGVTYLGNGLTKVDCYKTVNGSPWTWTGSGDKLIIGQFFYPVA